MSILAPDIKVAEPPRSLGAWAHDLSGVPGRSRVETFTPSGGEKTLRRRPRPGATHSASAPILSEIPSADDKPGQDAAKATFRAPAHAVGRSAGDLLQGVGSRRGHRRRLQRCSTWAGKVREGLAAVPTLTEEYQRTRYVVEHRAQIEDAIDHLNTQTPPQAEMEASIERSRETLDELQEVRRTRGGSKQS